MQSSVTWMVKFGVEFRQKARHFYVMHDSLFTTAFYIFLSSKIKDSKTLGDTITVKRFTLKNDTCKTLEKATRNSDT
jgi:hypothetical protein